MVQYMFLRCLDRHLQCPVGEEIVALSWLVSKRQRECKAGKFSGFSGQMVSLRETKKTRVIVSVCNDGNIFNL